MDTSTLSRRAILDLYAAIEAVGPVKADIQFSYALARTKRSLQPEIDTLDEFRAPSPEYADYLTAMRKQAQSYLTRGEAWIEGSVYKFTPESQAAFDAETKALQEQYRAAIDAHGEQLKRLDALLDEAVDVKLHRVKLAQVPAITVEQFDRLMPLIVGEDEAEERPTPKAVPKKRQAA